MDIDLILTIHKKLFPKATPYSQLTQLNEELGEYKKAETLAQIKEEHGDVLFVAISLLRFETTKHIGEAILDLYYYNTKDKKVNATKSLEKAVNKTKQRVSEERYKFIDGLYKRSKVNINV